MQRKKKTENYKMVLRRRRAVAAAAAAAAAAAEARAAAAAATVGGSKPIPLRHSIRLISNRKKRRHASRAGTDLNSRSKLRWPHPSSIKKKN